MSSQARSPGVVEDCCGVLTNYEVLHLLRAQSAERTAEETRAPLTGARRTSSSQSMYQTQQLAYAAAINDDVVAYLEETSCAKQTAESIAAFMKACERSARYAGRFLGMRSNAMRAGSNVISSDVWCSQRLPDMDCALPPNLRSPMQ